MAQHPLKERSDVDEVVAIGSNVPHVTGKSPRSVVWPSDRPGRAYLKRGRKAFSRAVKRRQLGLAGKARSYLHDNLDHYLDRVPSDAE
jgi:hypothetical protein